MTQKTQWILSALIVAGGMTEFTHARLPNTLNFTNITTTGVHQVQAELAANEKHVDTGDFDNDGDLDVVVGVGFSDFGARPNKLYRNDDGMFNEVSGNPVIPGFLTPTTTRNTWFRDLDNDGWLDIWEVNDSNPGNGDRMDRLYMNKHPGGVFSHFENETLMRMGASGGITGPECASICEDLNGDGLYDLYSGNYPNSSQDRMWFNNPARSGFFVEQSVGIMIPTDGHYTVDAAGADMNGDGRLDVILSNWSGSGGNRIYYNNSLNAGSGPGDLSYPNSVQLVATAGANENAMEPGDFDNDGLMDIYHSEGGPGSADKIWRNTGTGANGQAAFTPIMGLPANVNNVSVKATVHDFNGDGRVDVFVMMQSGRPAMLRNTTVNGQISFLDWTPGHAFPSGMTHGGWHATFIDYDNNDKFSDIFLGGWAGDHLFRNDESTEVDESEIGDMLPALFNQSPVAVVGRASISDVDTYTASGIPGNMIVSAVVNCRSDLTLEILNGADTVIATSNRGGQGVEEALQVVSAASGTKVRVTLNQFAGDQDSDGDLDAADFAAMVDCGVITGVPLLPGCEDFDFNLDGSIDMIDVREFQILHAGPGGATESGQYILEVLARTP